MINQISLPPLAVMCCGLGSAWPGMGRELYDRIPVCRAAMDKLAALADWDVLGLLDNPELEDINQTRKQIPYLFLLEFAQWSLFAHLGLKPALMSGHSIGELHALCFAGIYSPESAWHLLDIRAEHMASLEAKLARQGGMLAISADLETVSRGMAEYKGLRIANHNTSRQFILSGPLEELLALRKTFRRKRIPAFMLNMNLAFHHPSMAVLRDLSMRRLNALEMHPPKIPMLSCVTADLYPREQADICRYIADLDENTVQWTKSLTKMRETFNIGYCLELGPQETLCGLVQENEPGLSCSAASAKNNEVDAIIGACQKLASLGYLDVARVSEMRRSITVAAHSPAPEIKHPHEKQISREVEKILDLLAETAQIKPEQISPEMDLRRDLGIRSIRFPYLLQKAEQLFNRTLAIEKLLQISTVNDLLQILTGETKQQPARQFRESIHLPDFAQAPPLERFIVQKGRLRHLPYSPCAPGIRINPQKIICLCVFDQDILPEIWTGFLSSGYKLAVLKNFSFFPPEQYIKLDCPEEPAADELLAALEKIRASLGGILFAPEALDIKIGKKQKKDWLKKRATYLQALLGFAEADPDLWLYSLARIISPVMLPAWKIKPWLLPADRNSIVWVDNRKNKILENPFESGDLLVRELLHGNFRQVIWQRTDKKNYNRFCLSSPAFDFVWPRREDSQDSFAGMFNGDCQLSLYKTPALAEHGQNATYRPLVQYPAEKAFSSCAWLPMGCNLAMMQQCSQFLLPQLQPAGFSDIRVSSLFALPLGITRECAITAKLQPWLMQEGVNTRSAKSLVNLRQMLANGRSLEIFDPVCEGLCLFTAALPPLKPIWNEPKVMHYQQSLEEFYEYAGFGNAWRLLESFCMFAKNGEASEYGGILANTFEIAESWKSGYNARLKLVDALIQAALCAIHNSDANGKSQDSLELWRLSSIGYIRYGQLPANRQDRLIFNLRRSWLDRQFLRFDCQVSTASGQPLLTVHHLEFDKI